MNSYEQLLLQNKVEQLKRKIDNAFRDIGAVFRNGYNVQMATNENNQNVLYNLLLNQSIPIQYSTNIAYYNAWNNYKYAIKNEICKKYTPFPKSNLLLQKVDSVIETLKWLDLNPNYCNNILNVDLYLKNTLSEYKVVNIKLTEEHQNLSQLGKFMMCIIKNILAKYLSKLIKHSNLDETVKQELSFLQNCHDAICVSETLNSSNSSPVDMVDMYFKLMNLFEKHYPINNYNGR